MSDYQAGYDFDKHQFLFTNTATEFKLRLPITIKVNEGNIDPDYQVKYLMLLVQTGSAAVGVFEGETCLEHKVLSAYMVRKKQGKSQLKHLKTKGKSRAGSRVRLAKTLIFFEQINERITRHIKENEFDRIAFSCSKILMPHLFNSKVPTPFDRKDERIYKIPKHLHQPNFEVMLGMQRFLNKAELIGTPESLESLGFER
ncbi:hypothetical protein BFP71_11380 [Roseivirga misakiensis]|uniref:VLRF1 domain-containing protein n=2 Tax=Roseivirga misakiensis TaxID=1563681 RepID=A0A1E5T2F9_9BACT|nr:hypothetical protein BFP71_11380 [Roseivirga misakiensis]